MAINKTPPFSVEAEQGVVGGLLLDPAQTSIIQGIVKPSDFYRADHRAIFSAIVDMTNQGQPVDLILLSDHMEAVGTLSNAGGMAYLYELHKNVVSAANVKTYAAIVRERSSARAILDTLHKTADSIYDPGLRDIKDLVEAARQTINDVADRATSSNPIALRMAGKIETDSSAAMERIKSQRWLIDGILPSDAFGVLYGPSGGYKTFLAFDMAASIATASNWQGYETETPGAILYIAAEGALGLHMRKVAWEIRYQTKAPLLGILGSVVDLCSIEDTQSLIEAARQFREKVGQPIRMIIVDTLARTFSGDENSASDMGAFVRCCDIMREELDGASVMVVHHSGKDAERGARGSSALRAACDYEYKVSPQGKRSTRLICEKAKDSEPFEDMDFILDVVELGHEDKKGKALCSLVPRVTDNLAKEDEALEGDKRVIFEIIKREIAKADESFVFKSFARDAYFSSIKAAKDDGKAKMAWQRSIKWLGENDWIAVDSEGKITYPEPF